MSETIGTCMQGDQSAQTSAAGSVRRGMPLLAANVIAASASEARARLRIQTTAELPDLDQLKRHRG